MHPLQTAGCTTALILGSSSTPGLFGNWRGSRGGSFGLRACTPGRSRAQPHPYYVPVSRVLEEAGFAVELVPTDYDDGCHASGGHANDALVAKRRRARS